MAEQHEDFQDWELLQNPEDSLFFDSDDERSDYFSIVSPKHNHLNTEPVVVVKTLDDEQEMILGFSVIKKNIDMGANEVGFEVVSEMVGNDCFNDVNMNEEKLNMDIGDGVKVRNESFGDLRSSRDGEIEGVVGENKELIGDCEIERVVGESEGCSEDCDIEGVVTEDGFEKMRSLIEAKKGLGFDGVETNEEVESEDQSECESEFSRNSESEMKFEVDDEKSVGGIEVGVGCFEPIRDDSEVFSEGIAVDGQESCGVVEEGKDVVEVGGGLNVELRSRVEEEMKRGVVWWKVPLEIMKYCAFRVGPFWSFSIAAALMGLMILRKRMFRMKQKKRSIPLMITMDDKKVSQFMARAARLNDAFSVVKSGPIIRSVPVVGMTPWPIMALR